MRIARTVAVMVAVALLTTGCSALRGGGPSGSPGDETSEPPTQQVAPTSVVVPNVLGLAGDDANDALKDADLDVDWDAGAETVLVKSNWVVTLQYPAAGATVESDTAIILRVTRPENAPAEPDYACGSTPFPIASMKYVCGDDAETWPLIVRYGTLICEEGFGSPYPVTFEAPDGATYALNGTAKDKTDLPEIDAIWAFDPTQPDLKVDISPIIQEGLSICPS